MSELTTPELSSPPRLEDGERYRMYVEALQRRLNDSREQGAVDPNFESFVAQQTAIQEKWDQLSEGDFEEGSLDYLLKEAGRSDVETFIGLKYHIMEDITQQDPSRDHSSESEALDELIRQVLADKLYARQGSAELSR